MPWAFTSREGEVDLTLVTGPVRKLYVFPFLFAPSEPLLSRLSL